MSRHNHNLHTNLCETCGGTGDFGTDSLGRLRPCIDCDGTGEGGSHPCDECGGKPAWKKRPVVESDTRGRCGACDGSGVRLADPRPGDDLFNKWTTCEHTAWQAPGYLCCLRSRQITSRDEMLRLLGGAS